MTESSLLEDEGGGAVDASATSNCTAGVKNPILPMHKVIRRKKKKDNLEGVVQEIVDQSINEAYKKAWVDLGYKWSGTGNTWLDDAERAKKTRPNYALS